MNVVMRVLNYAINVSQVPQRSPFRFPGGKTWLIPVLRHWLKSQKNRTEVFVEPFAGGASASLMAVAEGYCDRAYLSEIDASVASVWSCVLSNTGTELADEVESFKMTIKNVDELFRVVSNGATSAQQALAVLVRNRVHRGGILAEGAGRLKKGENGKGISSRWYPETIARRLRSANDVKNSAFLNVMALLSSKNLGKTKKPWHLLTRHTSAQRIDCTRIGKLTMKCFLRP